jgi:hypothetical protein
VHRHDQSAQLPGGEILHLVDQDRDRSPAFLCRLGHRDKQARQIDLQIPAVRGASLRLDVDPDVYLADRDSDPCDEALQHRETPTRLVPRPGEPVELEEEPAQVGS